MDTKKLIRISKEAKEILEKASLKSGVKANVLASNAIKLALSKDLIEETLTKSVLANYNNK